jgi:hypothetical protein
MGEVLEVAGQRLLMVTGAGPLLRDPGEVLDLIGEAVARGARGLVLPADRLDPAFFRLRSGVAGEVLQKLATYRLTLVVLGDVAAPIRESDAFRDLVREADRGDAVLFVADREALAARLARRR